MLDLKYNITHHKKIYKPISKYKNAYQAEINFFCFDVYRTCFGKTSTTFCMKLQTINCKIPIKLDIHIFPK